MLLDRVSAYVHRWNDWRIPRPARRSTRPRAGDTRRRRMGSIERFEPRNLLAGDLGLEDVGAGLSDESFWRGPDPDGDPQEGAFGDTVVAGSFRSGNALFNNVHSLDFGSWNGWAYSNTTDSTTPGYENESSAWPGRGAAGSPTYAVAFQDIAGFFSPPTIRSAKASQPLSVSSILVTNTTTAALSMLQGDAFARRFGWFDGNGDGDFEDLDDFAGDYPDWFLLTIAGLDANDAALGVVEFYLADYRFADDSLDYVARDWTEVELGGLSDATQLVFQLSSSDVGAFGMNTPAYFALDRADEGLEELGFQLQDESFWNGPDPLGEQQAGAFGDTVVVGAFASSSLQFNNIYSLDFGSWIGWSYSNTSDNTTPGYENQYSAYAGSGSESSRTYAVAFQDVTELYAAPSIELRPPAAGFAFDSLQVTNTTNAALSMLQGDGFARRYGWLDANADGDYDDPSDYAGDYPDWFLLTVEGMDRSGESVGAVEFYLADYRAADAAEDYVVQDWTTVDLSSLIGAARLEFRLSSSDNGAFGMNTPAYFAADNVQLRPVPLSTATHVASVTINQGEIDPPDLPSGKSPSSWSRQRSSLKNIDVQFSQPMDWSRMTTDQVELWNLGVDAAADPDQRIPLAAQQLEVLDESSLRILIAPRGGPRSEDGVYQLALTELFDQDGNPLAGDGRNPGAPFVLTGQANNGLYQLSADWNGDAGVTIFDFSTLAYWFGRGIPVAPSYADLNGDQGISIFDFPAMVQNFGSALTFPVPAAPLVAAAPERRDGASQRARSADNEKEAFDVARADVALMALLAEWAVAERGI